MLSPYLSIIAIFLLFYLIAKTIWLIAPDWSGFREKSFWDLLDLLIVPIALAIIALWFNQQSQRNASEIALEQFRESSLQNYFANISKLMLDRNLLTSEIGTPTQTLAWQLTVAATQTLDEKRKVILLTYLYNADLIYNNSGVIGLFHANFSNIDFRNDFLTQTDLRGVTFENANLSGTRLLEANLNKANLRNSVLDNCELKGATFHKADLTGASLRNTELAFSNLQGAIINENQLKNVDNLLGAIMPDGSIYNGKYALKRDIDFAKGFNIDTSDNHAMNVWYQSARSKADYLMGVTIVDRPE